MSRSAHSFSFDDAEDPSIHNDFNELDASMKTVPISNMAESTTASSTTSRSPPTTSYSSSTTSPTAVPPPPSSNNTQTNGPKKLSVFSALFGECLCADGFLGPAAAAKGSGSRPAAQFIKLDGIECITLGAMTDEQTARQRVNETTRQLSTRAERLISIGYLVEEGGGGGRMTVQSIPLEVYANSFPNDYEMLPKNIMAIINFLKSNNYKSANLEFESILKEIQSNPRRTSDMGAMEGITVHNMAVVNLLAGNYEVALPLFQDAVRIKKNFLGYDHPEVAVSLDETGIQLFAKEQFRNSLETFEEAQSIRMRSFGADHPKVALVLNNIACCQFQMKNPPLALEMFTKAHEIQQTAMGTSAKADLDLLHVATTLCNRGYMRLRLKLYEDARADFEDALLVQQSVLGDNHKTVKDTINNLDFANAFHS